MDHMIFLSHSSKDKDIALAICHYLEEKGVRCWIAPRDIGSTDWASAIMDGLRRCDVFVVVLSEASIGSAEVTKEVTLATQYCQYILPFKVDKEELSDHLKYHLSSCHWLDAVNPPLEKRIDELFEKICTLSDKDAVFSNSRRRRLVDKIAYPRQGFVGRDEELIEIADRLSEENVLFLQGMGGIGKSEIAKAYAKKYRDRYDTVVFAGYNGSILETVIGDAITIENLVKGSADTETPIDFFYRKLEILKNLSSSRTLIILDNFDVDTDEHLEDLANGPYHLIITTRNEHWEYPTLYIDKISDFSKVRDIFVRNYGKRLSPDDKCIVDEILNLINCHTITVELIAKQMRSSHKTPAKMLELLKETGVNTNLKDKVVHSTGDLSMSSFDYIRQMFCISNLSEEEKHVMCCMTMLPYTGIDLEKFKDWCDFESYDDINSLISKSWLMLNEETDNLSMHPVICDVVKDQLSPDIRSCADYIHGLWENSHKCWYFTVEEREEISPYVAFVQNKFPVPIKELWREYVDFVNIAWMCGDFERAIESGKIVYEFSLKEFGEGSDEAGTAAMFLAGSYHNSGDNENARPYYEIGLDYKIRALGEDAYTVGISYSKLGRCEYFKHNFEKAKYYLDKALAVFENLAEKEETQRGREIMLSNSGDTVVEFARMYMEMGNYEKAIEYSELSYDRFMLREGVEIPNCAYSLVDLGMCYSKLSQFDKADEYLNRALELNIRFNGHVSIQTMRTREAIADNVLARGDLEKASKMYLEMELDLERDFGPLNPQVKAMREKRLSIKM